MNYAFKMIAVVLALGVLMLSSFNKGYADKIKDCSYCKLTPLFSKNKLGSNIVLAANHLEKESIITICSYATKNKKWDYNYYSYVLEAKRRGIKCYVKDENNFIPRDTNSNKKAVLGVRIQGINKERADKYGRKNLTGALVKAIAPNSPALKSELEIGDIIVKFDDKSIISYLDLGRIVRNTPLGKTVDVLIWRNKKLKKIKVDLYDFSSKEIASNFKPNNILKKEKEKNLLKDKQITKNDNQQPVISAYSELNGSNAIISGSVTDNTEVAEVLVDGEQISLTNNGTFKTELYIPRNGLNIEIVAYDKKGNKASKLLKIERNAVAQTTGPVFDTLNPSGKKVKTNPNALALIIGVADYEKTNADALYADKDAQQFYDYATMKLGISPSNIKELVNAKADRVEITLAVKDWIARSTKSGKTDIYVFFAGHGLSTADGKDMFLLPYDGLPRLLQDSAIKRDQLFADIKKANPKSVTVFLDTCYSGTTRGTDMLIASRPIAIRALEQSIPKNFTVFSAAAGDQTSKPLEEAKHGMFSYFLMKGMEGDADSNNDNKITARELHAYVEQNVVQQSSGSQTPELQGDKDRVLVQFK